MSRLSPKNALPIADVLREMFRDGTAQKVAEKYWIEPESLILE